MKNFNQILHRAKTTLFVLSIIASIFIIGSCDDNVIKQETQTTMSPNLYEESYMEFYYPDSGGLATKLIIKGKNLGTDTSLLKVTVNDKRAPIIKVNNDYIYAVVPARANTGHVKLYVTKGDVVEELTSDKVFKYKFNSNVSTLFGTPGVQSPDNRQDGTYSLALLRRPWQITIDNDGSVFFLDEGRGSNKQGALRRASNGIVETLINNNAGVFQSSNSLAFNKAQDTLFLANRWVSGDVNTTYCILYGTREGNFKNIKGLHQKANAATNSVAVHPVTRDLLFDSSTTGKVYVYNKSTQTETELGSINGANTNIDARLLLNDAGNVLYIIVRNKHCIYKANYNAHERTMSTPTLWVGEWGTSGYASGIGTAARFNTPCTPSWDLDGNILVPDKMNHVIRKVTPEGEVMLYAGQPNASGHADGLPINAKFSEPEAVVMGRDGILYVADRGNHCVRTVVIE